jgi:S-adenosylmethionine hydrolase
MAVVTFTTDFGTSDSYVGTMKGVVLSLAPEAVLVDITHQVPRHDIATGAWALAQAAPFFPSGTVHTAVIDPGVGGQRADVVVESRGQLFVGPDNGVLAAAAPPPRKVFRIASDGFKASTVSATFYGRDVFAVTAGQLAKGRSAKEVGPALPSLTELPFRDDGRLDQEGTGAVIHADIFGNLVTSFSAGEPRGRWSLSCNGRSFELEGGRTFSDVAPGAWVLYQGSAGRLEIAVREGSAAEQSGARVGASLHLRRCP